MNSLPPQQQIQLSVLFARFKTKQWTLELRDFGSVIMSILFSKDSCILYRKERAKASSKNVNFNDKYG